MRTEYQTFSINLNGIGCQTDLLPIHIKAIDYKLYQDLIKFIKKYNKHIESNKKYVFNGSDYILIDK